MNAESKGNWHTKRVKLMITFCSKDKGKSSPKCIIISKNVFKVSILFSYWPTLIKCVSYSCWYGSCRVVIMGIFSPIGHHLSCVGSAKYYSGSIVIVFQNTIKIFCHPFLGVYYNTTF